MENSPLKPVNQNAGSIQQPTNAYINSRLSSNQRKKREAKYKMAMQNQQPYHNLYT